MKAVGMVCLLAFLFLSIGVMRGVLAGSLSDKFSNKELREKFGLDAEEDDSVFYQNQQKYQEAKDRDYQILLELMEESNGE